MLYRLPPAVALLGALLLTSGCGGTQPPGTSHAASTDDSGGIGVGVLHTATPGPVPTSATELLSRARAALLAAERYHVTETFGGGAEVIDASVLSSSDLAMTGTLHVPAAPDRDSAFLTLNSDVYVKGSGIISSISSDVAQKAGPRWVWFRYDDSRAKNLMTALLAVLHPFGLPQATDGLTVSASVDAVGRHVHVINGSGVSLVINDADSLPIMAIGPDFTLTVDRYGEQGAVPSAPVGALPLSTLIGP